MALKPFKGLPKDIQTQFLSFFKRFIISCLKDLLITSLKHFEGFSKAL